MRRTSAGLLFASLLLAMAGIGAGGSVSSTNPTPKSGQKEASAKKKEAAAREEVPVKKPKPASVPAPMEPRISLITLGVSDLPRSIHFYTEGLGLKMENDGEGIALFSMNGVRLALYPREALAEDCGAPSAEPSGFSGITLAHNVDSRKRVDCLMKRATEAGATLLQEARDRFWGGYSGYFADPDGHIWEIAWNPHIQP